MRNWLNSGLVAVSRLASKSRAFLLERSPARATMASASRRLAGRRSKVASPVSLAERSSLSEEEIRRLVCEVLVGTPRRGFDFTLFWQLKADKRSRGHGPHEAAVIAQGILQQQRLGVEQALDFSEPEWPWLRQRGITRAPGPYLSFRRLPGRGQSTNLFFQIARLLSGVWTGKQPDAVCSFGVQRRLQGTLLVEQRRFHSLPNICMGLVQQVE